MRIEELLSSKRLLKMHLYIMQMYYPNLKYYGYKDIIYGRKKIKNKDEEVLKNSYDALVFLFKNKATDINDKLLDKFIILLANKKNNEINVIIKEANNQRNFYSKIKRLNEYLLNGDLINFIIYVYFISFFYYRKTNIIPRYKREEVRLLKNKFDNKKIKEIFSNQEDETKYYQELIDINQKELEAYLLNNKANYEKEYKIKSLYLFGSYMTNTFRIDSDIDLIIEFKGHITYEEKEKYKEEFEKEISQDLKRRVDMHELCKTMLESDPELEAHMKEIK